MKSNPSGSTASGSRFHMPEPTTLLLPILLGILRAAPWAAFFPLLLGPEFGVSQGREAPWVWALAIISALGFWAVRFLPRIVKNSAIFNVLLFVIGIAAWAMWMRLTPGWDFGTLAGSGLSIVGEDSRFAWTLMITMVFWILTLRLALDEREQSSEGTRGIMMRSLLGIVAGILIASWVGGTQGDAGLRQAFIALPAALVSGVGAVGMSEMAATRSLARKRGTTVPGWDRWLRVFLGTGIVLLVITLLAALVFGPGFVQFVLDALRTVWSAIATVLLWIVYGIVYVFVFIARGIAWLLNAIFGTTMDVPEPPQMQPQGTPPPIMDEPYEEGEPWQYAEIFRFVLLALGLLVGGALLFRFARFRSTGTEAVSDEERTSVFSGKLLRDQLRNLFRRRSDVERPRRLDLASDPATVREAMLYLQVLAERLDIGREHRETPHDFSARLQSAWPGAADAVADLTELYENVRYGETERDRSAAVAAWRVIWADRSQEPGATSPVRG